MIKWIIKQNGRKLIYRANYLQGIGNNIPVEEIKMADELGIDSVTYLLKHFNLRDNYHRTRKFKTEEELRTALYELGYVKEYIDKVRDELIKIIKNKRGSYKIRNRYKRR